MKKLTQEENESLFHLLNSLANFLLVIFASGSIWDLWNKNEVFQVLGLVVLILLIIVCATSFIGTLIFIRKEK